jgi:hypothetical protein
MARVGPLSRAAWDTGQSHVDRVKCMSTEELKIIRDLVGVAESASQTLLNLKAIAASRELVSKYEARS